MAWRILHWLARLTLGFLFLAAGYTKLRNPFLFEMAVDAYRLLPPTGVIIVARTLPWLELALGLLLLSGWKLHFTASLTALLLGVFLVTMASTFSRGVQANCGCIGFGERISGWTLARDSALFAFAVYLAVYAWMHRRRSFAQLHSLPPQPATD